MFNLVQALNFRCFRYLSQPLEPFHILVGPNASGKSTFLDIISFLSDLAGQGEGLAEAVSSRTPNFRDLVWMRDGDSFELAVEAPIPQGVMRTSKNGRHNAVRYEVKVGLHPESQELCLLAETLWLLPLGDRSESDRERRQGSLFPSLRPVPNSILRPPQKHTPPGWRKVVAKSLESGNDYFFSETSGWNNPFKFGPRRSALANLPNDEERFPVAMWFRQLLSGGVQFLRLNSEAMRKPCPPGSPRVFQSDGSNLPLVVEELMKAAPERMKEWVNHLRTSLTSLKQIGCIERPEDKHSYLKVMLDSGLEVSSWLISDGTLRLLAMTLLAYAPHVQGPILVEEPENGIHPKAVETIYQSLSSIYDVQVLIATHSPVLVGLAQPRDLLCFGLTEDGVVDVVSGDQHPRLKDWQQEVDLGTFFASGVLG